MSAGRSRMGRQIPTTPGSSSPGVDRIGTPPGRGIAGSQDGSASNGALAATAARMRLHCRHLIAATAAKPNAQMPPATAGIQFIVEARAAAAAGPDVLEVSVNGSIMKDTTGAAFDAGAGIATRIHTSGAARIISAENGTRNLTDAASQIQ